MSSKSLPSEKKKKKKGGRIIPALLNLIGSIILLSVIAVNLPLTVPRIMGYEIYNVVSGSMEPAIPIGSLVYVKPIAPEEAVEGDVIAFMSGSSIVIHRVVQNSLVEGEFRTKGDANEGEDFNTVAYANVIGKVDRHIPILGELYVLISSTVGKVYMIGFALCGGLMNVLAGRMRAFRRRT